MDINLENILIASQVKPTAMRLLVLEHLLKQKAAISLANLETEFNRSDRITLYRTLKTFEERGIIHTIKDGTEVTKYALCQEECQSGIHTDMHVHFYCTNCKELYCLPKVQIPEIKLPDKFNLQEMSLVARGICNNCYK
jgi:Fur family ferric uptake transcriptional regulator